MSNMICPISQCPIDEIAYTVNGSMFDKKSIEHWFDLGKKTDPLTNEMLESQHLVLFGNMQERTEQEIIDKAQELRRNYNIWSRTTLLPKIIEQNKQRFIQMDKEYIKYAKEDKHRIIQLNIYARRQIIQEYNYSNRHKNFIFKDYQYLQLSSLTVRNACFKNRKFCCSDLTNSLFINCNFSRSDFHNVRMDGTVFIGCSFIGEETNFTGANGKNTKFSECCIEPIGSWNTVFSNSIVFYDILKSRGFITSHVAI